MFTDEEIKATLERIDAIYGLVSIDALAKFSHSQIECCSAELDKRAEAMHADREVKGRWTVTIAAANRAVENLVFLMEAKRQAIFLSGMKANEMLGEASPFWDDRVIRAHEEYADYNLLSALRRRTAPTPARKPGASRRQGTVRAVGDRPGESSSTRNSGDSPSTQAPGTVPSRPEHWQHFKTLPPKPDVADKYFAWREANEEWTKKGDYRVPMPEYPPEVLEDLKLRAHQHPEFAQALEAAKHVIARRERQVAMAAKVGGFDKLPSPDQTGTAPSKANPAGSAAGPGGTGPATGAA